MESPRKLSASVIAAAVVAILGSLLLLLGCSAAFFLFLLSKNPGPASDFPPVLRTIMLGSQGFMMAVAIFGIATGIGLLYLRNWARISILTWGGLLVFFGLIGIVFIFLMPLTPSLNGPPVSAVNMSEVRLVLCVVYGLPLIVGVWWLVLFTRSSVKSQFTVAAPPPLPGVPPKPACPLPISVLAWFYVSSILNLVFLPFVPARVPVFVFGWILPGSSGLVVLILTFLAFFVCGIGLLKLKPWSYTLTMALQIFGFLNLGVSMLRPNYKTAMNDYIQEVQASMHLPPSPFAQPDLSRSFSVGMAFGLLGAVAVLSLLLFYRSRFLENAARAASTT